MFSVRGYANHQSLNLSTKDGLSQHSVYSVVQDSKGFIWMATEMGLNKYDGNAFTIFKNNPTDKSTISNNFILSLVYDSTHECIWIGTNGNGISKFDLTRETFTNYLDSTNPLYPFNAVSSIYIYSSKMLIIGTLGGGFKYFDIENELYNFHSKDRWPTLSGETRSISKGLYGEVWIGTLDDGLYYLNPMTQTLLSFPKMKASGLNNINSIQLDVNNQCLWIGSKSKGLWKFDYKTLSFNPINQLQNLSVHSLLINAINTNELWIATSRKGLILFDQKKLIAKTILVEDSLSSTITTATYLSLYQGRDNSIWLGTKKNGVKIINPVENGFFDLTSFNSNISKSPIKAVFEDHKGTIWAYSSKLLKVNPRSKASETIPLLTIDTNHVNFIISDIDSQYLWIGHTKGLIKLNTKTLKEITLLNLIENSATSTFLTGLFDRNDILWLGTKNEGLFRFNPINRSYTQYLHNQNLNSLQGNTVTALFEDRNRNIWVGTAEHGLSLLNSNSMTFEIANTDMLGKGKTIYGISEDQQSNIWIATDSGLVRFKYINQRVEDLKNYTTTDGIVSNTVYGLTIDDQNQLWVSTDKGICKLAMDSKSQLNSIDIFDNTNGLSNSTFLASSFFKSHSNHIYFGNTKGLTHFNPEAIVVNPISPNILISRISINNQDVAVAQKEQETLTLYALKDSYFLSRNINYAQELSLSNREKTFSFELSSSDYLGNPLTSYAYKIEGIDSTWQDISEDRTFTRTSLPAGNYTLFIRSKRRNGVWSKNLYTLKINIKHIWWSTLPFKLIALLGLIGSSLLIVKLRYKNKSTLKRELDSKLKRKKDELFNHNPEILEKALELIEKDKRLREAEKLKNSLSNFWLNELKKPLKESSKNKKGYLSKVQSELPARKLLQHIFNVFEIDKLNKANPTIHIENFNLNNCIYNAISFVNIAANEKDIEIEFKSSSVFFVSADEILIEYVCINLLNNAIQYSDKHTKITIELCHYATQKVMIKILDEGKGISTDIQHQLFNPSNLFKNTKHKKYIGLGIQYCMLALKAHASKLEIHSKAMKGSTLYFNLPLLKAQQIKTINTAEFEKIELGDFEPSEKIRSIARQLNNVNITDASKILTLIGQSDVSSANDLIWVQHIKQSIFSVDVALFNRLIETAQEIKS